MVFRGIIPQEIIDNICRFPGPDFLGPISDFDYSHGRRLLEAK